MPLVTTRDGRRLGYDERGAGAPLLCVPGGPGFGGAHLGDLGGVDRVARLVLLDTRGVGDSDPPADPTAYELDDYAADVEAVRVALDLGPVDVFGHSHGALVAVRNAVRHPGAVRRLVLDGMPVRHGALPDDVAAMFGRWDGRARAYVERALTVRHGPAGEWFFEREWPSLDVSGDMSRIDVPTLVIVGEHDPVAIATAEEAASLLPAGRLAVVRGAGHFAWVEQPGAYAAVVAGFLRATA